MPCNPQLTNSSPAESGDAKTLLLASLVQNLRVQRNQTGNHSTAETRDESQQLSAPVLAKKLSGNKKLMIELAIELTKEAMKEI